MKNLYGFMMVMFSFVYSVMAMENKEVFNFSDFGQELDAIDIQRKYPQIAPIFKGVTNPEQATAALFEISGRTGNQLYENDASLLVSWLHKKGADVNAIKRHRFISDNALYYGSPLSFAVDFERQSAFVSVLLAYGACPNLEIPNMKTSRTKAQTWPREDLTALFSQHSCQICQRK